MSKVLIKVSTPKGPNFKIMDELAIIEVREFCEKVGYECKIIGVRKNNKKMNNNVQE
jgi:hypothetical protein